MTINQKYNPLTNSGFNLVPDVPSEIGAVTSEPTGVISSQITVSYDPPTRTMTITPTGSSFDVYIKGVRIIKTGVQSVAHPNVAGEYFFEYDATGTLTASLTPFNFLERAQIASVRFDPAQTPAGWRLVETHGVTLDGAAHSILHATIGTRLVSGGTITGGTITVYSSSDTYNAANSQLATIQPGIDQTVLADEDILTTLPALIEATGYTVMRKRWTSNNYEWLVSQTAPFYHVGNVPQYNPSSGGDAWVPMTNTAYTCWYLVGIPAGIEADSQIMRFFWFNGGIQYVPVNSSTASREVARNNALAEDPATIDLTDLISTEYNVMHKLVVVYDTGNTGNDYRLRIAGSQSVRGNRARPIVTSGITATNHGSLSGLTAPNSHPATAISTVPTDAGLDPAIETDVELAIDRLSEFAFVGEWATGKDYRVGNVVLQDKMFFYCSADHTSTTSIYADLASWEAYQMAVVDTATDLPNAASYGSVYLVKESGRIYVCANTIDNTPLQIVKSGSVVWNPTLASIGEFETVAAANTFVAGDWVAYNSGWVKAKADSINTCRNIGRVYSATGSSFILQKSGYFYTTASVGDTLYISDATAGAETSTAPTTVGNIIQPVGDVAHTGLGHMNIQRSDVVGGANVNFTVGLSNNTTVTIVDVSSIPNGGSIEAQVVVDATADSNALVVLRWVRSGGTWYISQSVDVGTLPAGMSFTINDSTGVISCIVPDIGLVAANSYVRYSISAAANGFDVGSVQASLIKNTDGTPIYNSTTGEWAYKNASGVTTFEVDSIGFAKMLSPTYAIKSKVTMTGSAINVLNFTGLPQGIYLVSSKRTGANLGTNGIWIVGFSGTVTSLIATISATLTASVSTSYFLLSGASGEVVFTVAKVICEDW